MYKFRGIQDNGFSPELSGQWAYGSLLQNYWSSAYGEVVTAIVGPAKPGGRSPRYRVRPETVGQWTGGVDSEGVEIYIGDKVISDCIHLFRDEDIVTTPAVVEWRKGSVMFRLGDRALAMDRVLDGWTAAVFTVVGNIHQDLEVEG